MALNPKEMFHSNPELVKAFSAVSHSSWFPAVLEAALSAYTRHLITVEGDPAESWQRVAGAREFAEFLLSFADKTALPKKPATKDNLNHTL